MTYLSVLTAPPAGTVVGETAPLAEAARNRAVQACPAAPREDDCPYCSGPETD